MDTELRTRHRAMWASGDYPGMVETFLLPLGPRLVDACGIEPGMLVLDVAAGTGNASIPAAERGARVTGPGHARPRGARGHGVHAPDRLRRPLQGELRADDRRAGQREPRRPRA